MLSRCSRAFLSPDLRLGNGTECGVSTWRNSLVSDIVPSREQAVACVLSTGTENLLSDMLVSILDTAANMQSLHMGVLPDTSTFVVLEWASVCQAREPRAFIPSPDL